MVLSAQHFRELTNGYEKTTTGLWTHRGRLQVLGGPVDLPAGSIDTAEIAAGAVQSLVGSVSSGTAWNTTTSGSWVETPFQFSGSCSGERIRVEGQICLSHSVAGAQLYIGWGLDHSVARACAYFTLAAGQTISYTLVDYAQPTPGAHTFSIYVYNGTVGTLTFVNNINAQLFAHEQKR